jgi:hypothetical protein
MALFQNFPEETPRQFLMSLRKAHLDKRLSYDAHWQLIAEMMQPRRARFSQSDAGVDGSRRNDKIINNSPLIALRVATAGMMAGITSPARRWFRFGTMDPELATWGPVREYLYAVENILLTIFAKSNWYTTLAGTTYKDLLAFGTHCSILESDEDEVIRMFPLPMGEYWLAVNHKGVVDMMGRDFTFTVRQLIRKFGLEKCSNRVKDAYQRGQYEQTVPVLHIIMPNDEYRRGAIGRAGKGAVSVWMETQADDPNEGFLKVSGYDKFPVLGPRWELTNSVSDVYGHCPGMDALGDTKELQHHEAKSMKLLDKMSDPAMNVPDELRASGYTLVPGTSNYIPRTAQGLRAEPAQIIQPQALVAVGERIQGISSRVGQAFYVDLWLDIINSNNVQPRTAREITERHEEKMLQLGPVVNRAEKEILTPGLELTIHHAMRQGLFPPAPRELINMPLGVEYLSVMSQAQRLINVGSTERFIAFAISVSERFPEVTDNVNIDNVALEMGTILGVPPKFLRDPKEVAKIRAARAEKDTMATQAAIAEQATKSLSNMAGAGLINSNSMNQSVGPIAGASMGVPGVSAAN